MYTIGQLSRKTGVKVTTIRYYEQVELLATPGRNAGNQRRYDDAGLQQLSFISHARELGLSISDIRELSDLSSDPNRPCAGAHQIAARHLGAIRERIARLKRLEQELNRIATMHDGGRVGECHVISALADHSQCQSGH